ncbi:MAG: hypothetical protein ACYTGB_11975, partial [Planctomycetota bacterium]
MSLLPLVILLVIGGLILGALLALILGIVALLRINRSGGALRGRGLAIAAIVIGGLMLLGIPLAAVVAVPFLWLSASAPQTDEVVITSDIIGAARGAEAETRTAWKLRGGKVLVAGTEDEARFVILALDPEGRDAKPLGAQIVFRAGEAPEEKPHRLGASMLGGVET